VQAKEVYDDYDMVAEKMEKNKKGAGK
jgi:hypothetical protein